ncbi:MAG: hypothetical protein V4738_14325 [Pseudomonadota bacterium]
MTTSHANPPTANPICLSSDRAAAVDVGYHYRPINTDTPRGAKLLLIRKASGVATLGQLGVRETYFDHFAPLPVFLKD